MTKTYIQKRRDQYAKRSNLTNDQLKEFYKVEKQLSARLRDSTREERLHDGLYASLYDEMYKKVPFHPQLMKKSNTNDQSNRAAASMQFLSRYLKPDYTFLEIGAGDCALSLEMAKHVEKVYAIDVSNEITKEIPFPDNLELILSDGVSISVPKNCVNIAYSNQLMEHLHPDDAIEQLSNIFRALAPGGSYVCSTPNKLSGPADVSQGFDAVATGFHLKEYLPTELYNIFRKSGFSKIYLVQGYKQYISWNTPLVPITVYIFNICEKILSRMPYKIRSFIAKIIFRGGGMTVIGVK